MVQLIRPLTFFGMLLVAAIAQQDLGLRQDVDMRMDRGDGRVSLEVTQPASVLPADAVLLNHPTLTKMIDRMVSDALVYRVQDPKDRRKVLMFVSDRGKALCRRLNSLAVSQEAHIVESYGDKSTTELKRLLESLIGSAN